MSWFELTILFVRTAPETVFVRVIARAYLINVSCGAGFLPGHFRF